jgi:hypothetical protein
VSYASSFAKIFSILLALLLSSGCEAGFVKRERTLEDWTTSLKSRKEFSYSSCEYQIIRKYRIPVCDINFNGLKFVIKSTPIGFEFFANGPYIPDKVGFYEFASGDMAMSYECRPAQMFSTKGFDCAKGGWEGEKIYSKKRSFPDRYFIGQNDWYCSDCFIEDKYKSRFELRMGEHVIRDGLIARVNGKNIPVEPVTEVARQFAALFSSSPEQ